MGFVLSFCGVRGFVFVHVFVLCALAPDFMGLVDLQEARLGLTNLLVL